MITLDRAHQTIHTSPLLKNIPKTFQNRSLLEKTRETGSATEHYKIKINLETIHYTGTDYGYGWTFVISTLNHHWVSNRIQIQRGKKSLVNKDVYSGITNTTFDNLQQLPITICAQHRSGFKVETILYVQANSFKRNIIPKSIYPEVGGRNETFQFHEIQTVLQEDTQLMFVLNFEITPNVTH